MPASAEFVVGRSSDASSLTQAYDVFVGVSTPTTRSLSITGLLLYSAAPHLNPALHRNLLNAIGYTPTEWPSSRLGGHDTSTGNERAFRVPEDTRIRASKFSLQRKRGRLS